MRSRVFEFDRLAIGDIIGVDIQARAQSIDHGGCKRSLAGHNLFHPAGRSDIGDQIGLIQLASIDDVSEHLSRRGPGYRIVLRLIVVDQHHQDVELVAAKWP